jgi:hypothetical protein
MDKDSTTFGLKPGKLAQLWNIGDNADQDKNEENDNQTKRLRDRLAEKISLDKIVAQILPKAFAQVCKEIQPFTGNSCGVLLNDPLTDITILEKIKDNHKKLAQHLNTDTEYEVITAIYYAAIASALVYHDRKITSFSYDHLNDKYNSLLQNTWLTPDLRNLFQKAAAVCGRKMKSERKNNS